MTMNENSTNPPELSGRRRRSWWWRWLRRLLLVPIIGSVLLVAAWPWRWELLSPLLRPLLQQQLGSLLQADIELETFEGSIIGGIGLRGLQATPADDSALQAPSRVGHIAIDWKPWALLWGGSALDRIILDGVTIDLTLPPSETAPGPSKPPGERIAQALKYLTMLAQLPKCEITDVNLRLDDLRIEGANLVLDQLPGRTQVRAQVAQVVLGRQVAPITDIQLQLSGDAQRVELGSQAAPGLRAKLGGGPVALWGTCVPDSGALELRITGDELLALGSPHDAIRRVRLDLDLNLSGTPEALAVTGEITVPVAAWHGEFAGGGGGDNGAKQPDSPQANPLENVGVELPMHHDGGLAIPGLAGGEFISVNLAVRTSRPALVGNTLLATLVNADLRLRGNLASMRLSGLFTASQGEVRVVAGTFIPIDQVRLQLPETPGAGAVINYRGRLYIGLIRIDIAVTGNLADPTVSLTSDPPYSQEELLALLAFGRLPGEVDQGQQAGFLAAQAVRIAKALYFDRLPRPQASAADKRSNLLFEMGSSQRDPDRDSLPFELEAGGRAEVMARAEYIFNKHWSIITTIDQKNNPSGDIQYRVRFGGDVSDPIQQKKESESVLPPFHFALADFQPGIKRDKAHGRGDRTIFPNPDATIEYEEPPLAIPSSQLRYALNVPPVRPPGDTWNANHLSDAAFRITRAYRDRGYLYVRVTPSIAENGDAVFSIDEGRQVLLKDVVLEWYNVQGQAIPPPADPLRPNQRLSETELKANLFQTKVGGKAVFSERLVEAQTQSLANTLQARGFRDASIEAKVLASNAPVGRGLIGSVAAVPLVTIKAMGHLLPGSEIPADRPEHDYRIVHLRINPGQLYRIGNVTWSNEQATELIPTELLQRAQALSDQPFTAGLADEQAALVRRSLRNLGYQFAICEPRITFDEKQHHCHIDFQLDPGLKLHIGHTEISGTNRVRSGFVNIVANLKPDDLLQTERLRRAQRRLLRTGLFRSVSIDTVEQDAEDTDPNEDAPGVRDLHITVQERQPFEWRGRVGYGTVDQIRLGSDFIMLSPFGGPERFRVGGEANFRYQSVDAELTRPWLFNHERVTGSIRTFWVHAKEDHPKYEEFLYGATASLAVKIDKRIRIRPGLLGARIVDVAQNPDVANTVYSPFLELSYDHRDSKYKPHQGLTAWYRHEFASQTLGSTLNYHKDTARVAVYLPLGNRFTLALGAEGGLIQPLSDTQSNELPRSFRFTAGGPFSVRGFEQDSLGPVDPATGDRTGGDALVVLRSELRAKIWGDLHGALFSDWGNVFLDLDDVEWQALRQGVGPGLRFYTPAGALMLDLGWKVDPEPDERDWRLHFSFGMPF
jgi:outer membrane protein assembly complex protein YaeT